MMPNQVPSALGYTFNGLGDTVLTSDQIARQRRVADALMTGATSEPVTNWASGAANLVDAFNARQRYKMADEAAGVGDQRADAGAKAAGIIPATAGLVRPTTAAAGAATGQGMGSVLGLGGWLSNMFG